MASKFRCGDASSATWIFRSVVVRCVVFSLAVLVMMAMARTALGQHSTSTTTNYPDGSTKTQDTTTTRDDGSKSSETHTEYDENGQPTSETQKFYDPDGKLSRESEKTWVWDPQKRLTFFEEDDDSYGGTLIPRFTQKYRIRKKYKDDKDTEGTTTQEQVDSSASGGWRDFDSDGGDTAPSTDPIQPVPPKVKPKDRSKLDPSLLNRPLGEEPGTGGTEQPKPETPKTPPPATPPPTGDKTSNTTEQTTVAIALPANAEPGDTISGTATDDPTEIAEMQQIPAFHITLVPVPQATETAATPTPQVAPSPTTESTSMTTSLTDGDATLSGMVVQVNGTRQPADKPLVAKVPQMAETIAISLLTNDADPRTIAQDSVPVTTPSPSAATETANSTGTTAPQDYEMPPVSKPGAVEVIRGPVSGNTNDMQIAVDGVPAKIITATPRDVLYKVPADLPAVTDGGARKVVFTQKSSTGGAPKIVTFPLYDAQIKMTADTSLVKGETTPIHITVSIPQNVPASVWQSGTPPTDLVDLKTLDDGKSGLKAPKPTDEGFIAVLIEDETPGVVRLGKNNSIVLQLHQKDFVNGTYTYNGTMQTVHAGAFVVRSRVVAFLKDAQGQESMNAGN